MISISVILIYFSLQYIQVIQISICLINLQHRGFVFEFSATFRFYYLENCSSSLLVFKGKRFMVLLYNIQNSQICTA